MERVVEDDDLLEQILLHIPAEIVYGFKLVSKHWCNLISSQSFCRRHGTSHLRLPNSNSKILMIDQSKGSAASLLDVRNGVTVFKTSNIDSDKLLSSIQPFYEKLLQKVDESKEIEFKICDAYNGLFLFSLSIKDRGRNLFSRVEEVHYLVCNPLTKEYQELVLSSKYTHPYTYTEVAFAPSKPYDYYKVILVSVNKAQHDDYVEYIVQIYSSETQTWKDSGYINDDSLYDFKYVVWDNCLLLVPKEGDWCGPVCVLDSERLHVSDSSSLLHNFIDWNYWINYLGESGGFLYVIVEDNVWHSNRENYYYTLWEMNGVDGSWREKFEFKTEKGTTFYVHKEGEHVWLVLMPAEGAIYYCLDGNTERLEEAGYVGYSNWGWNLRSYTPTLFPLGGQ